MAIPTLPGFKRRRRGAGQEVNDFVKAFLATRKAFSDTALAEKRGKLYDAQIARYEEMNAASKERRERAGKGGGGVGMSDEQFQEYVRAKLGKTPAAAEPKTEEKKPEPPAPINPRFSEAIPTDNGLGKTEVAQNFTNEDDQNAGNNNTQMALNTSPSYDNYSYDYAPEPSYGNYEPTAFAAEGGTIEEAEAEDAPLEFALDAALRNVQSSYGLDGRGGAVDDGRQAAQLEAFARNEGAVPEDAMTDLLATVDPNAKDQIGAVLQKVYGFHANKGDREGAAQAVGSILKAARQESMDAGALALAAIEQRDFRSAGDALIDAYNKVPDGRYVEGSVDERGIGEALIRDARTNKVVQRLPLNPQTLQMAAQRFQSGADFYNHVAQFARPPMQRAALAVDGGMIDQIDEMDREDERLVEDLPLEEQPTYVPPQGGAAQTEENEADLPAEGATAMQGATAPVERIPYQSGMNASQRRQIDAINRTLETRRKEAAAADQRAQTQRLNAEKAAVAAEEQRARNDPEFRRDRELRVIAAEEARDKQRLAEMAREANRASLAGEDVDVLGTRTQETASPVQPWRRGLTLEAERERERLEPRDVERNYRRLNVTAKAVREEDAADREELEKKFDTYATSAKQNERGQVDPTKVIKVAPEVRDRLIDVAENITRYNRLSAGRAAEFAYDAVFNQAVAPKITQSDRGFRVTIGNRSITMDSDTFRVLAEQRANRTRELQAAARTTVEQREKAQEAIDAARARRAQQIDDYRTAIEASPTATARKRRTIMGIDPTR